MPREIGSNFYYHPPYQSPSRLDLTKPPIEIFPPKERVLKIIQQLKKEIEEIKAGFEDQKILENIPLTDNNSSYGNGDYIRPGEQINRSKKAPVIIPAKDPRKTRLSELKEKQSELKYYREILQIIDFLKEIKSLTPAQLEERKRNKSARLDEINVELRNNSAAREALGEELEEKNKNLLYRARSYIFKDPLVITLEKLENNCDRLVKEKNDLRRQLYLLDIQYKYKTKSFSPRTEFQD